MGDGKLDFWRGSLDTAARCGHVIVTCGRVTYINTPYGPIVAASFGRTWENMKTWTDMSIIISWIKKALLYQDDGRLWSQN